MCPTTQKTTQAHGGTPSRQGQLIEPRKADWPGDDDWERIACTRAGQPGHTMCGWCAIHGHPRWAPCPRTTHQEQS